MAHKHSVYDTDPHFSIDAASREITNHSDKVKLMQNDHNAERFTFEVPRFIDGHDMSLCNKVVVHYINEHEKGIKQLMLLNLQECRATNVLTVATAKAVQRIPDAHCNGDMTAALAQAAELQKKEKDFLMEQGIEHIFDNA